MNQKKIMDLLHARSEQAIDAMHTQYGKLCHRVAVNLLGCPEDAEEIVNDAYWTVWNQIPPDAPQSLAAYITGIVRNKAISRIRHDSAAKRNIRMHLCLDELATCIPGGTDPEQLLRHQALTAALNRFLGSLSKQNRQIFVRRYYHCDSAAQIARDFGMRESTLRSRLLRIRQQLHEFLKKEEWFE